MSNHKNCAAQHFGAWAIEPKWLRQALASVQAGTWKPAEAAAPTPGQPKEKPYRMGGIQGDIAIITIDDQITKGSSSFGGTSSVAIRKALRAAADDGEVRGIMLLIDSPGGTVSGTGDLADDVKATNKKKPVWAYVEDLAASAAYWIASQCQAIFANPTAMVGSIGTYAVLEDTTGMQDQMGVKLTVVSSGQYKGLGADGKVTDKLIEDVQREIDAYNGHFLSAVAEGRGLTNKEVIAVADGRVWIADKAKELGLIDSVSSIDDAMTVINERVMKMTKEQFAGLMAEHPDWIAGDIEQAKRTGEKDAYVKELTRIKAIREACGGDDSLALDVFIAGKEADDAKLAIAASMRVKAAHDATIKAQAAEIEKLKAQVGTQGAVGTSVAAGNTAMPAPTDAKAKAEKEWDENPAMQPAWIDKKTFVAVREKELAA